MEFADILDSWVWIENPKNELERRINAFVQEDNFHYNFLLHDAEEILGFTLDRYGSYAGVMRHVWGDETKAIRQLMYSWIAWAKKTDDPMIVLTTFEAMEAGLKDLFEVAYAKVFLPAEGELKFLEYFGKTHVELEVNHTVTSWFKEGEQPYRPLSEISVTEETKSLALEVVEDIFEKYTAVFDALYNLAMAEDSIRPEKYRVDGYPPIHAFPEIHPNRVNIPVENKDEL